MTKNYYFKINECAILPAAIGDGLSSEYTSCQGLPSSSSINAIATSSGNDGTYKTLNSSIFIIQEKNFKHFFLPCHRASAILPWLPETKYPAEYLVPDRALYKLGPRRSLFPSIQWRVALHSENSRQKFKIKKIKIIIKKRIIPLLYPARKYIER